MAGGPAGPPLSARLSQIDRMVSSFLSVAMSKSSANPGNCMIQPRKTEWLIVHGSMPRWSLLSIAAISYVSSQVKSISLPALAVGPKDIRNKRDQTGTESLAG